LSNEISLLLAPPEKMLLVIS